MSVTGPEKVAKTREITLILIWRSHRRSHQASSAMISRQSSRLGRHCRKAPKLKSCESLSPSGRPRRLFFPGFDFCTSSSPDTTAIWYPAASACSGCYGVAPTRVPRNPGFPETRAGYPAQITDLPELHSKSSLKNVAAMPSVTRISGACLPEPFCLRPHRLG